MTTPNKGFDELIANQSQPHVPVNSTFRALDAIVQLCAIAFTSSAPGSPSEGDVYIVDVGATGTFAGHDGAVAYYSGGWQYASPEEGWLAYVQSVDQYYTFGPGSPGGWSVFSADAGSAPVVIQVAASDLVTALALSGSPTEPSAYLRAAQTFTISEVRASLLQASTSGVVTVDIRLNGVSIFSTKLTIDANEKTSVTAAAPPVLAISSIVSDDEITVFLDTAGTDAKGLIVTIIGTT